MESEQHQLIDVTGIDDPTSPGLSETSCVSSEDPFGREEPERKTKRRKTLAEKNLSEEELQALRLKINGRERKRMHDLNSALDGLREVMPYANGPSVRKLSKIGTLLLARNYILMLQSSIDEMKKLVSDVYSTNSGKVHPPTSGLPTPTQPGHQPQSAGTSPVAPTHPPPPPHLLAGLSYNQLPGLSPLPMSSVVPSSAQSASPVANRSNSSPTSSPSSTAVSGQTSAKSIVSSPALMYSGSLAGHFPPPPPPHHHHHHHQHQPGMCTCAHCAMGLYRQAIMAASPGSGLLGFAGHPMLHATPCSTK